MSDKYGYIGLETLLNFCSNDKNHCVTPNDFMRMNRVKIDERPHGEWKYAIVDCYKSGYICTHCNGFAVIDGKIDGYSVTFCPNCGSNNRPKEGDEK